MKKESFEKIFLIMSLAFLAGMPISWSSAGPESGPEMSPGVKVVEHDSKVFSSDPVYQSTPYNSEKQLEIYGGKYANPTARPLLELGRGLYKTGPLRQGINLIGEKNELYPHAYVYGDVRSAIAYNKNKNIEQWTQANRLNLDMDVGLTATERVHALMRPLDKGGKFTRWDISGEVNNDLEMEIDGNVDALFFEGDMNPILAGVTDHDMPFDLPFAVGFVPLLFQNGIWMDDAFNGLAFTIPARNSAFLDISNMDVTFFSGYQRVTTKAVVDSANQFDDRNTQLYGMNAFIEANQGYWEVGYGYTDPNDGDEPFDDFAYHNAAAAFTRRYWGLISNSMRVIWNYGQDRRDDNRIQTADGVLFLMENSLITPKPLTLVPYFNLYYGIDRPQALARDAGSGGLLKNTGINFETDGLTGFPKLDDTGTDTMGGALGIEYLFDDTDHQMVWEVGTVKVIGGQSVAKGNQLAVGFRYQLPLTHALIIRLDIMAGFLEDEDDLLGAKIELRRKF